MNPTIYRFISALFPFLMGCLLLLPTARTASAMPEIVKSLETLMEIPEIKTVSSSETHLYVLSGREGLIVFRTKTDSLQWLYTSSGLTDRGDRLVSDIRFSYLFGKDGRLTVIEPTSVLGVYSSTRLESDPNDLVRINNDLFLAVDNGGLLTLSLETSESVDRTPETAFSHDRPIISVARQSDELFALDDSNRLFHFEYDEGFLNRTTDFQLPGGSRMLHEINHRLYVSTETGEIYRVRSDGRYDQLFGIEDEAITHLKRWNGNYLIRGESKRIWIARQGLRPSLFRNDPSAGNHITTFKNQLWISEFAQFSRWVATGEIAGYDEGISGNDDSHATEPDRDEQLRIASIDNQTVPYPRPLLLPLTLESNHDIRNIRFQQKSRIDGIKVRGNSLYWQPSSSDVGTHTISVIASSQDGQTDSTSFRVNVRPFNSPPRFSRVRPLSIPVNEEFSIPFQASDPDGVDSDLIRYIGVDLPEGASLDEKSGEFSWTPSRRQTGEHEFQVIATDQYGAAASMDVSIQVIELDRGES